MIYSYLVCLRAEHGEDFTEPADHTLRVLHLPVEMSLAAVAELVRQYDCTENAPEERTIEVEDWNTAREMYALGHWFCRAWGPSFLHQNAEPYAQWTGWNNRDITLTSFDLGWYWEGWCDECHGELEDGYGRICIECDEDGGYPLCIPTKEELCDRR